MNLQPVVAHLDTHTAFRQTGGAADLAAVEDAPVLDPAAFVVPLGEQIDEESEDCDGGFGRRVQFGVLAVVANRNDPRGAAAQDALHTARVAVESALPPGCCSCCWLLQRCVRLLNVMAPLPGTSCCAQHSLC